MPHRHGTHAAPRGAATLTACLRRLCRVAITHRGGCDAAAVRLTLGASVAYFLSMWKSFRFGVGAEGALLCRVSVPRDASVALVQAWEGACGSRRHQRCG